MVLNLLFFRKTWDFFSWYLLLSTLNTSSESQFLVQTSHPIKSSTAIARAKVRQVVVEKDIFQQGPNDTAYCTLWTVSLQTNIPKCELLPTQSIICQRQARVLCLNEQAYHTFLFRMFALELTPAGVFDNVCFCQTLLALTLRLLCSLYR